MRTKSLWRTQITNHLPELSSRVCPPVTVLSPGPAEDETADVEDKVDAKKDAETDAETDVGGDIDCVIDVDMECDIGVEADTDVEPEAEVVGDNDVDIDCDTDVYMECDIDIEADAELEIEGDTDEKAEATTDSVNYEDFRELYIYNVYLYICFQLNTQFPKTSYTRKESLYMMKTCIIWHLKS